RAPAQAGAPKFDLSVYVPEATPSKTVASITLFSPTLLPFSRTNTTLLWGKRPRERQEGRRVSPASGGPRSSARVLLAGVDGVAAGGLAPAEVDGELAVAEGGGGGGPEAVGEAQF